jgi:hypothetical protein
VNPLRNIDSMLIEGKVWVPLKDLIDRIELVANTTVDMAEAGNVPYLAIQGATLAELGAGLDGILKILEQRHKDAAETA